MFQGRILRTDDPVIMFIVYILVPFMFIHHGLRPLVVGGQRPLSKLSCRYAGPLGRIRHDRPDSGDLLFHLVIDVIKRHAVMYVAGGHNRFQNITVYVTDGVGLVRKTPFWSPLRNIRVSVGDKM